VITNGINKQFSKAMGKVRKSANAETLTTIATRGKKVQRSDPPIA